MKASSPDPDQGPEGLLGVPRAGSDVEAVAVRSAKTFVPEKELFKDAPGAHLQEQWG